MLLLLAARAAGLQESPGGPVIEQRRMPDGSLFLLLPRPGSRVVRWASFVRMGREHEPQGVFGLSEACHRSSLAGTWTQGSGDQLAEKAALVELDRALADWHDALEAGSSTPSEAGQKRLEAKRLAVVKARAEAAKLGDPLLLRRSLAVLPGVGPRVETGVGGSLLSASVPATRVLDFALLMEERRRDAALRTFHRTFEDVRHRLRAREEKRSIRYLRAACQRAILVHPRRLSLMPPSASPRFFSWQDAVEFYQRHQRPERTVTVLVGDFDVERIATGLNRIFVHPPNSVAKPVRLPGEPAQVGKNLSQIRSPGAPSLVLGYRIPEATPLSHLSVLEQLFLRSSRLESSLVRERGLAEQILVHPSFPELGWPALFVIEISSVPGSDYAGLIAESMKLIEELPSLRDAQIERAIRVWRAARRRLADDPRRLAETLAREVALEGRAAAEPEEPSVAAIRKLVGRLLDPARLTMVEAMRAPVSGKQFSGKPPPPGKER